MVTKQILTKKARRFSNLVLSVAIIAAVTVALLHATTSAAGSVTLTMQASASTYTVGDDISVSLYENNGTTTGVDAFVNYSTADITYSKVDNNGAFNGPEVTSAGSGSVEIARTTQNSATLTGTQLVDTIHFTATAAGSVSLTYGNNSVVDDSNGSNILNSTTGANFTIQAPASSGSGSGSSSGSGSGQGSSTPVTTSGSKPVTATPVTSSTSSVSVSAKSTGTPVTVSNGGSAQVSAPVDIQPSTVQTQGVSKVEYILDGKVVATETQAPYTYHLDTTQLNNGSHTLVVKTDYANGTNKTSTQHLFVTDGIKKSASGIVWVIPPLVIILVGVAAWLYIRFIHFGLSKFGNPAHAGAGGGMVTGGAAGPAPEPAPEADKSTLENLLSNVHNSGAPPPSTVVKPNDSSTPPDDHEP